MILKVTDNKVILAILATAGFLVILMLAGWVYSSVVPSLFCLPVEVRPPSLEKNLPRFQRTVLDAGCRRSARSRTRRSLTKVGADRAAVLLCTSSSSFFQLVLPDLVHLYHYIHVFVSPYKQNTRQAKQNTHLERPAGRREVWRKQHLQYHVASMQPFHRECFSYWFLLTFFSEV